MLVYDEGKAFTCDCSFMIEDESVILLIDVTNGKVVNWKEGVDGEFTTVKIVDCGSYQLLYNTKIRQSCWSTVNA